MRWLDTDRVTGLVSLALAFALLTTIPLQVTIEPIPGTGDYVNFTPAAVPRICAAGFLAVGVLLLVLPSRRRSGRAERSDGFGGPAGFGHVVAVLAMLAAYAFLLEPLGYLASTVTFLVALNLYAGTRRALPLAIGAVVLPLAVYYLFGRVMLIPLPEGTAFG